MRVFRVLATCTLLLGTTAWSPAQAQQAQPTGNNAATGTTGAAQASLDAAMRVAPASPTDALQGTITGVVLDAASQRPLSSAQVFIQGSGLGGLTNAVGRFLILNVPVGVHTLRAELIGYTGLSQQVTVTEGGSATIDFRLAEQALGLDEIVVTGTAGQARRREIGNQITQVRVADVPEPASDIGNLLQGRMAGSRVNMGSGSTGSGPDIRLRGNVSAALSNQPLIYIDGMRAQSEPTSTNGGGETPYSPLNDLNPDDIERIEVVKGPAATTLYGTEAAAGVIQIFTKRGGQGAPQWTAEVQQGVGYFRPFATDEVPYMYLDPVFQNGHRQRYSMSVRGGGNDLGYFVSGAYTDNVGAVETEAEDRMNLRANTTFRPHQDLLIQFNNSLTRTNFQQAQMGNSVTSIIMTAVRGPRNYMAGRRDAETLRLLLENTYNNTITRAVSGITFNYTPGSDFTHRLTLGYDFSLDDHFENKPHCWICPLGITSDFSDFIAGGEIRRAMSQRTLFSVDYVSTLGFDVSSGVRSTLSFGAQAVQSASENTLTVGRHFPGPGDYTLGTAATRHQIDQNRLRVVTGGFFGQNMFAFADKYFVTVGVRVDGSSAFGEELGFEVYPKLSGSYVISDEGFWPESMGQVKLRGAYGFAGRAPGAFDKVRTWNPVGFGSGSQAFYPQNLGNDGLGPERTAEVEVGFDAGWMEGRLSADVTYFRQVTTDALFQVNSPGSVGGWNSQLENVGKMQNSGLELNTNATIFNTAAFRWDLGLGLATNKSTVLDLGGTAPFSVGSSGWVFEGQPLPVIYGQRVMNPYELADPVFSDGRVFYGPANPDKLYSLTTSLRMPGGLQLSARGELSTGGWIFNNFESNAMTRNVSHPKCYDAYRKADPTWDPGELGSRAQPAKPTSRPEGAYAWEMAQCFGMRTGDHNMQQSDFAELRDLTLSVPVSNLLPTLTSFAQRTDLTISARNLIGWKHKSMTTGHPEMDENGTGTTSSGEFRHDFVRSIAETLPPTSLFTVSMRVVF
jgi:TonB-dependent SusC/RagA subfamily outer membrane receptor